MKIYIAAPLFNESELERNINLNNFLKELGFETYLPQEDGGVFSELIQRGDELAAIKKNIFQADVAALKACDIIVCVLDGRVPDEGMCVELGMAHALGKICLGYSTDTRSFNSYGQNIMIEGCLITTTHTLAELKEVVLRYKL